MTKWLCYECKNSHGECNAPCIYIDPTNEMHAPPLKCTINDAKWVEAPINYMQLMDDPMG